MQIDVHYPVELRKGTNEALARYVMNVPKDKPALNATAQSSPMFHQLTSSMFTRTDRSTAELEAERRATTWVDAKRAKIWLNFEQRRSG